MNKVEATLKCLEPLVYAYQKDVREGTFEVYAAHLVDVPPEYLRQAVSSLITTSKWLPTVAELRDVAREIYKADKGIVEETAETAWIELLGMVRYFGMKEPKPEEFSSKAAYMAMKSITWRAICMASDSQLMTLHRQYIAAYDKAPRSVQRVLDQKRLNA